MARLLGYNSTIQAFAGKRRNGISKWRPPTGTKNQGRNQGHLARLTLMSLGRKVQGTTGLYHVALRYPTRATLADALRRLYAASVKLDGASDHGVSEALYLRDPDGNGLELYWDRPRELWPKDAKGELQMVTRPLDLNELRRVDR
jgi:catechol-2,3-dioxygenase